MSTLSGIFPNAITPSVNLPVDPEQQAQLRRQKEAAVFSPVGATEASAAGQNRAGERPARQDSQKDSRPGNARTQTSAQPEGRRETVTANRNEATAKTDTVATEEAGRSQSTQTHSRAESDTGDRPAAREQSAIDQQRLEEELQTIRELAQRDREVRNHEQAHQAVGGQYAGAMSLTYTTGPDGKRYAVAGEVSIDISPVPGDPQATMDKAERIRRAALAPAEPSVQDRAVAAQAAQLEIEAQAELRQMEREAREAAEQEGEESRAINEESDQRAESASRNEKPEEDDREQVEEETRERQNQLLDSTREITDRALVVQQYRQTGNTIGDNLDFLV